MSAATTRGDRPALTTIRVVGTNEIVVSFCHDCLDDLREPHTWKDCAASLRRGLDAALDRAADCPVAVFWRVRGTLPRERDPQPLRDESTSVVYERRAPGLWLYASTPEGQRCGSALLSRREVRRARTALREAGCTRIVNVRVTVRTRGNK